jgi:malate dehydrogenase (oxaloacetate-decarboxylating)
VREGLARHAATPEAALARLDACRWRPEYVELQVLDERQSPD